jgi:predicted phosphodiesterase
MRRADAVRHKNPYAVPSDLLKAIETAGGRNALARAHGVHTDVIDRWMRDLGVQRENTKTYEPFAGTPLDENDEGLLASLRDFKGTASIEQLADHHDTSPKRIREAVERLAERGYRITPDEAQVTLERVPPAPRGQIHTGLFDGDTIRFAVISDTHLGSKEERLEELHCAYDLIEQEGIERVIHPGDLVCGKGIYGNQVRDIAVHTFDEQVAYAVREYPQRDGVHTSIISGNHDLEGDFGKQGADPVRAVANLRDDFTYLGEYDAWLELANGAYVHILHPKGGASYALSYKPQKLCEGYESGRKPAMLLIGHYHRHGHFAARNIEVFLCGTFEGSTNLAKRYGMGAPSVGFWIIEATLADDASLVRIKSEWHNFFVGRKMAAAA